MGNLKEIRTRINSIRSTQQITKAMKMVAAAKLRKAQEKIWQMRPYAAHLKHIMQTLGDNVEEPGHLRFYELRDLERVLLVPVTSEKGLCGSFNNSINRMVVNHMEEQYNELHSQNRVDLLCVGKKSCEFFTKRGYNVVDEYPHLFSNLSYENVDEIAQKLMDYFLSGKYDKVVVYYNWFKNAATYFNIPEQFLPVIQDQKEEEKDKSTRSHSEYNVDYIFEPTRGELVRQLIPKSLKMNFYRMILDSNASEHGARMTAMDQATDNAEELVNELRRTYNKERQAAITKEILEVVSGANALERG